MEFPRPAFNPEQHTPNFDFQSLVSGCISDVIKREKQAIGALAEVALADETKPGILISAGFKSQVQDTYVFESTVAFDESVPRGEVRYAPLPTGWLQP